MDNTKGSKGGNLLQERIVVKWKAPWSCLVKKDTVNGKARAGG